jgi:hypothetical protein
MSPAKSCGAGPRPRGGPCLPVRQRDVGVPRGPGGPPWLCARMRYSGRDVPVWAGCRTRRLQGPDKLREGVPGSLSPGCVNLAVMYRQGVGMPKNEALVASSPGVRSRVFGCLPGARTEACPAARRGPAGCAQNSDLRNFPNCNPRRAGQNNLAALEMTHLVRSITFYGTST